MSFAKFYDEVNSDIDYDYILKPIMKFIKKDSKILDAGCGSGHILHFLSNKKYTIDGLDIDPIMVELASIKVGNSSLVYTHDLNNRIDRSYDVILMLFDVINYFDKPDKIYRNIYDALNPNGVLILDFYIEEYNDVMDGYRESGQTNNYSYEWLVKKTSDGLQHKILIDDIPYEIVQYIHGFNENVSILEKIGFIVEKLESNDDRKHLVVCRK